MIELYHHGILGQKWGKKNGPPYPLSRTGDWSAAERRSQKKNYKVLNREARRHRHNVSVPDSLKKNIENRISDRAKQNVEQLDETFIKNIPSSSDYYDLKDNVRNYLLDSGLSKQDYKDVLDAYVNYNNELKKAINEEIGKYANKPMHRYYNTEKVGDFVYDKLKIDGPSYKRQSLKQSSAYEDLKYINKYAFNHKKTSWNDIETRLNPLQRKKEFLVDKSLEKLYRESVHGSTDSDYKAFTKKYGITPTEVNNKYKNHLYEIADQILGEYSNKKIGNKKARDVFITYIDW